MKYNIWNKWDKLEVCMLGNNYYPEFWNGMDSKIADPLKRICTETLEDLENYKETLQQFGVEVIQPTMDINERFIQDKKFPRGPLQPRDAQLVLGNNLYYSNVFSLDHPSIVEALLKYDNECAIEYNDLFRQINFPIELWQEEHYNILAGDSWPRYEQYKANRHNYKFFDSEILEEMLELSNPLELIPRSADLFMIGTDIYVEEKKLDVCKQMPSFDNYRWNTVFVHGSHADGCFHPIKPGAILSLYDIQTYENTFPNWDVCYLQDESWSKVDDWLSLKEKNRGRWWIQGEENNNELTYFVNEWLDNWVGYVEESVFDVNVLVLDEHHVCVNNLENQQVLEFLKKHNMEPVHVPFRHRYFWDGGLHCITLDLKRQGKKQDYFPNRDKTIHDEGFEW